MLRIVKYNIKSEGRERKMNWSLYATLNRWRTFESWLTRPRRHWDSLMAPQQPKKPTSITSPPAPIRMYTPGNKNKNPNINGIKKKPSVQFWRHVVVLQVWLGNVFDQIYWWVFFCLKSNIVDTYCITNQLKEHCIGALWRSMLSSLDTYRLVCPCPNPVPSLPLLCCQILHCPITNNNKKR